MMGYCPWSAVDLISTHEGMVKRYGFIYVDREEFDLKTLVVIVRFILTGTKKLLPLMVMIYQINLNLKSLYRNL